MIKAQIELFALFLLRTLAIFKRQKNGVNGIVALQKRLSGEAGSGELPAMQTEHRVPAGELALSQLPGRGSATGNFVQQWGAYCFRKIRHFL